MRLASIRIKGSETLAVFSQGYLYPIADINRELGAAWPATMDLFLAKEQVTPLKAWFEGGGRKAIETLVRGAAPHDSVSFAPLCRTPPKIWGIGLNYTAHAQDLDERPPTSLPASFMKPATAIVGCGDTIQIPALSQRTTAEAELGIVIGKRCKSVSRKDWLDVVAGFTCIIDMTAEDILRQNPRYLTLSKSFDTFFSFGPQLVTPDEIDDVFQLTVSTVLNGHVHAENTVSRMTFPPDELVAFHSKVMTLLPGDVISTGTPGAVPIRHGDEVTCRISGFAALTNHVADQKEAAGL